MITSELLTVDNIRLLFTSCLSILLEKTTLVLLRGHLVSGKCIVTNASLLLDSSLLNLLARIQAYLVHFAQLTKS